MARLARSVIAGYPHHVFQCAQNEQIVFESTGDYRLYLGWLRHYAVRYGVDIWAYCLMPNHVHLICVPKAESALARAINTLNMRYAQYFNSRHATKGHLWLPRFMSCVLDAQSVQEEVRFIETNPVRACLVSEAHDYLWSSARAHVIGTPDAVLNEINKLKAMIPDWRAFLREKAEQAVLNRTRARLRTGRPAGDPEFLRMLEAIAGRRLEALPRGRPRKPAALPNPACAGVPVPIETPHSAKRS
jgi:putative transposase